MRVVLKCVIMGKRYVRCFKMRECGTKICELFFKCVSVRQRYASCF